MAYRTAEVTCCSYGVSAVMRSLVFCFALLFNGDPGLFNDSLYLPLSNAASSQVSWGIPDLFMFFEVKFLSSLAPPSLLQL